MDRAPDYVEPLEGWRVWEVAGGPDAPRLRSLVRRDCRWPVGAPLTADCPSGEPPGAPPAHEAPEPGCWCGIHAFADDGEALRTLAGLGRELDGPVVIGTVRLWGRVVQCTRGLRGQHGYPGELWVPYPAARPGAAAAADRLCHALGGYGVPVHPLPIDGWGVPPTRVPRPHGTPTPGG